jgi:hypothetical protein
MAEFVMPTLGSDMTEGTLVQWKKKVGQRVVKGEIIAEVDTEKTAIESPLYADFDHATDALMGILWLPWPLQSGLHLR